MSAADTTAPKQQIGIPFEAGKSGNPKGRPKGSRNKFAEQFLSDFLADWENHGAAAIVAMREESPKDYVKIGAMILPKQVEVTVGELEALPDDELLKRIDDIDARIESIAARKVEAQSGSGAPVQNTEAPALPTLH